jgi:hypothetical protein
MVDAGRPAQRESAVTELFVAEALGRIVEHAMQGRARSSSRAKR